MQKFIAPEFLGLTLKEQIEKCRAMAAEAKSLAAGASAENREAYLNLDAKWSELADEMERQLAAKPANKG